MLTSLCLLLFAGQQPPQPTFKPPQPKSKDIQKFHLPEVIGTRAEVRLHGYEQRVQLERESPFSQLLWKSVGPEYQGGRVIAITSPLDKPSELLVAFATGGLWRTNDDGISWTPLFEHESSFSIGDFAVSRDGQVLWVGTGENNSQRTSYSGTGVFKSLDGGKTWQNMGLPESHHIGRILLHPKKADIVYVAALGHLYSKNSERGVYKTSDGGNTWQHVLKVDSYTGIIDLAMDPRDPETLYAAAWDRDRRAWNFRESGPGSAIYKTTNGGRTWSKLVSGLPVGDGIGRAGLAVSPVQAKTVYAFIDNNAADPDTEFRDERQPSGVLTPRRFMHLNEETLGQIDKGVLDRFARNYLPSEFKADEILAKLKDKKITMAELVAAMEKRNPNVVQMEPLWSEVYRSDDAGLTWHKTHAGKIGPHGGYYGGRIVINPTNSNDILTTGTILLRSLDGGKSWHQAASEPHVDFHAVWFDPRNPRRMAVGSDGGFYLSLDNGEHWRHINNLPVGQFTSIAVDNKRPYNIYGGLQDNGTMKGPSDYSSGQGGPFSRDWTTVGWGDGSAVAVDPRDDGDQIYTASQFGAHEAMNQKTGARWGIRPSGRDLRFNWVSPILISPHHPDILYIGSQKLHRSLNQGKSWEALSDDLSKNRPNGNVPFSTMKDLSESPFKFGLVYCGFDDGTLKMTKDHGSSWIDIHTPERSKWVSRVLASKWDPGTVYCSQTGYRDDDFTPYLWKSADYGKSWKSIVGNLPSGEPINVIREDPEHKEMLYVGTDLGVFVSYDVGATWEPLSGGIPRTPVHDLAIQARDEEMVIATHARSVWKFSLKPLYEVTPELRKEDLHVWSVSDMERSSRWGYGYREMWDQETRFKPALTGRFWSKNAGKGSIRIRSKDGKTVKEQPIDVSKGFNFYRIELELTPGKVSSELRKIQPKTGLEGIQDPYQDLRPLYVEPGEYKVEITVGNVTKTVDWKLTKADS